jgi:hypothetical protein
MALEAWGGLMNQNDHDYYRARLAAEEAAAREAGHPLAARRHRELAEHYAGLIARGVRSEAA